MSKTSFRGPAQIAATMFLLSAGTQLLPAEPLAEEPAPTTQGTGVLTSHPGVSSNCAVIGTWLENDFQWSDKYYTNAIKIAYTTPEVFQNGLPGFMKNLVAVTPLASRTEKQAAAYRFHFALAQEIYTAKKEHIYNPPLDDHPYTSLLYATFGVSSETENRLDALEIGVGILGPSALGRQTQNTYHKIINVESIKGWDNQLHDEPLFQFSWTRIWRFVLAKSESFGWDFLPRLHLEAGTARDYLAIGWQWRFGWNLPDDFGVSGLRDTAGTTRPARTVRREDIHWKPDSFYFFFDVQSEAWAWNAPLDGNAWHHSRKVDSRPLVAQISTGLAAYWGHWRLSFSEVVRTREFRTQDHAIFVYTSIGVNLIF